MRANATPVASIPYQHSYDGWYTVEVTMNGRGPYRFIIDTGATVTAIFEKAVQSDLFRKADGPPKKILGVSGARFVDPTFIGDIKIGNVGLSNHVGVVVPNWDTDTVTPDGILGLDFLANYFLVFDASRKQIDLYPREQPPIDFASGMTRTKLRFSTFNQNTSGLYVMTVQVSGRRIPSILDLGSNGALFNYPALRRLTGGVYVATQRAAGSNTGTNLKGVFDDTDRVLTVRTGPVKVGEASWARRTLLIHDAGIFRDLGVHRKAFGLIGADLFNDRHIAIDFENENFYVSKGEVPLPRAPLTNVES